MLANYLWDTALPQAAEEWVLFERISSRKVNIAGTEFYRLEFRARLEPEQCLLRFVDTIGISSSFPGKPYGFGTFSGICEDSLATYSAERETLLNSFRP